MGQNMGQRGGFRAGKREFKAGIGVQQKIAPTRELCDFFNAVDGRLAAQLPPRIDTYSQVQRDIDLFKLQPRDDDGEGSWHITVAELRLSGARAERKRLRWGMHDVGRVRGELEDRIDAVRSRLDLPIGDLSLRMSGVERVGAPLRRTAGVGRKLALIPAEDDPACDYLHEAFGVVREVLRLEDNAYMPHLTICALGQAVTLKEVGQCADTVRELLDERPLTVTLSESEIYSYSCQRESLA